MRFFDWFKQLVVTYNKGLDYDKDISFFQDNYNNLFLINSNLFGEIKELEDKNLLLDSQLKNLLKVKEIDVLALKDLYEEKYGSNSWFYKYDGENLKDVKYSLRETKAGTKILVSLAQEIIDKYDLSSKSPEVIVGKIINYFSLKKSWTYKYDKEQFGKIEFWQLAEKSAINRVGDCDDLAILMHCLIKNVFDLCGLEEHYWRIKLVGNNTLLGGHALNIWLGDDGEWYAVESTLDIQNSLYKTWLKTPIINNNLYGDFWGFARKDRSWKGTVSSLKPINNKILDGGIKK